MTTPTTRRRTKAPSHPGADRAPTGKPVHFELIGLGLVTLGILLLFSTKLDGWAATALVGALRWLFGVYGAFGIAGAFILLGIVLMVHMTRVELSKTSLGMAIIFLVVISQMQLQQEIIWNPAGFTRDPGGFFGGVIASAMHALTGKVGAVIVLSAIGLGGVALMTDITLVELVSWPFKLIYQGICCAVAPLSRSRKAQRAALRAARVAALQREELQRRNRPEPIEAPALPPRPLPPRIEPAAARPPEGGPPPSLPVTGVPSQENPEQLQFAEAAVRHPDNRPYVLPPLDLLTATPKSAKQTKDDSQEKIAILEETLSSFGIDAKVVEIERGPRVTRFEVVPPPGVRINRITNLADNLALSLSALDVRVEAPVPGKGVVGIEVPNHELVMVDLREILESDACKKNKSPLAFALGRDISGHPRIADLAKMPHLLIAGATNSGKSVCINSLICSILMRATPMQVKFLLVDPKRVELSLFQSIPHLIAPVAHDAKHAAGLLRWAIREMEQRYEMFAEKCVRNITGFNEQSRLEGLEEVPYIVIVIDELADLMMQAAGEFEASICRLAQLARATGIHLVVATQRPSVNVITGTIKANIPSRIAFAVASQVDSRTILDMNGAERLVGQGDMLFLPVDASKPVRIQGCYVSEIDTINISEHVKSQAKPFFSDEIVSIEEDALREDKGENGYDEPEDELFEKALDYIRTTRYASTSMLQRKFRIGYTRAARLMDQFEERGYVGPGQGSKPREVIYTPAAPVSSRPADVNDYGEEDEEDEN